MRWVLSPPLRLSYAFPCSPQHTIFKAFLLPVASQSLSSHSYTLPSLCPTLRRYVDTCSASGFTALHFAVACNCVPAILALLAHDAHIDDFNIFDAGEFWISCATKSTPLHIAAISNRLQCAVAILQYFVSALSLLIG